MLHSLLSQLPQVLPLRFLALAMAYRRAFAGPAEAMPHMACLILLPLMIEPNSLVRLAAVAVRQLAASVSLPRACDLPMRVCRVCTKHNSESCLCAGDCLLLRLSPTL